MRTRSKVAAAPVLAVMLVLAMAGPAVGGGWATVELSSTPDGVRADEVWEVDLRILQHGRTPLEGIEPTVRVVERDSDRSARFLARPMAEQGVYRARVTFPAAGKWRYFVDDGFTQVHSYPPVTIADGRAPRADAATPATPGADDGASGDTMLAGALGVGLAAAGLTVAIRRRRKHPPTSSPLAPGNT